MSHKKDARLIWVNEQILDSFDCLVTFQLNLSKYSNDSILQFINIMAKNVISEQSAPLAVRFCLTTLFFIKPILGKCSKKFNKSIRVLN